MCPRSLLLLNLPCSLRANGRASSQTRVAQKTTTFSTPSPLFSLLAVVAVAVVVELVEHPKFNSRLDRTFMNSKL
jgi:hypothetical protein